MCPPAGQPSRRFFITFLERFVEAQEAEEGETGSEGAVLRAVESPNKEHPRVLACVAAVVRAVKSAHTKHPQVLANKQTRALLEAFFLSFMTGLTKNEPIPPLGFAAVVMMIEDLETCQETTFDQDEDCSIKMDWLKNKDVLTGCERSFVKYPKERIPCSCLDVKYALLRSLPKTGLCWWCGERKDRKQLQFCVACKAVQYYSKQCQAFDWPEHKEACSIDWLRKSDPFSVYL